MCAAPLQVHGPPRSLPTCLVLALAKRDQAGGIQPGLRQALFRQELRLAAFGGRYNAGTIKQLAWSQDSEVLAVVMGPAQNSDSQELAPQQLDSQVRRRSGQEDATTGDLAGRNPPVDEQRVQACEGGSQRQRGGEEAESRREKGGEGGGEDWTVGLWVRSNWHWYLKMQLTVEKDASEGLMAVWDLNRPLCLHFCTRQALLRTVQPRFVIIAVLNPVRAVVVSFASIRLDLPVFA